MIKKAFSKLWKGDKCREKASDEFTSKIFIDEKFQKAASVTNFPLFLRNLGACGAHGVGNKLSGKKGKKGKKNDKEELIYF